VKSHIVFISKQYDITEICNIPQYGQKKVVLPFSRENERKIKMKYHKLILSGGQYYLVVYYSREQMAVISISYFHMFCVNTLRFVYFNI